jgi:tRNA(Arg) A34 adenosine deaminase TadA
LKSFGIYLTKEPNPYEAMALVHSRVRRVIFGIADKEMGGLGGVGVSLAAHCLPGTNHHYRAFRLNTEYIIGNDADVQRKRLIQSLQNLHPFIK